LRSSEDGPSATLAAVGHDRQGIERRYFPPVREGYDRDAVDAYLRELAVEVEALAQASGALHERARALGGELQALTHSLRAGAEQPSLAAERPTPTLAPPTASPAVPAPASAPAEEDLDSARLVALNMALGGEPREQADRLLARRFHLADRAKLLDEVYAAVEG
jgi:DivIVA domain-containing protein